MIIISLYGGLVSQIRAFYIGYKLSREFEVVLVLDLSQYYNGYYRPYLMDFLNVIDCSRIAVRGTCQERIALIEEMYHQKLHLIKDAKELETIYNNFDLTQIYYIMNDCCNYDEFCKNHLKFFYRYIGNDLETAEIMDMMQMITPDKYIDEFDRLIKNCESVGVHIRLQDFRQVGWMVEQDYDFYRAAIQWCREKMRNSLFFVFSDDIVLAKRILGIADDIIYMANTGQWKNDVEQLLCLSKCKHRILSKKSGFSLFAQTIAQNKWKSHGYTLLIEHINFANNASEREYVDNRFNKEPICKWEENIHNCVLLKKAEIKALNRKYLKKKIMYFNEKEDISVVFDNMKKNRNRFIFLTLQTYSETVITGMERMAKWLAFYDNEVHFVGEQMELACNTENNSFAWTLDNKHEAKDFNGNSLGYMLYPYVELNRHDNYMNFIEYICRDKKNISNYVIVRKKNGMSPLIKHRECGIKFIFIDFSDKFEKENWSKLSDADLEYLYQNADLVITFDKNIYKQYKKIIENRIIYINIQEYLPDIKKWNTKIENLCEINECEDELYRYMFGLIRSFFDGNR